MHRIRSVRRRGVAPWRGALLLGLAALSCGGDAPPPAPETGAPAEAQAPAARSERRAYLANGDAVTPGTTPLDGLEKIDLAHEQSSGNLTVEANDPMFPARMSVIIDGDTTSMTRSESINPLILTLTFREPIRLAAARLFPAGSAYDWLVEPTPGGERLLLEGAPDSAWSQIDLEEPVSTSVVQLEILRRERDDYVHIDEIELYTTKP
jgi:hypothetical protein